jgi:3-deoxy-manno-octulosonate cytidylyltransferase (CMP-KDO synthetase)
MNRAIGIIPARFGSTRLPEKPLVSICGKPLIYWVWKQASKARSLDRVLVATDNLRVKKTVEEFGGKAVLTSANFTSGSDRVASVAARLNYDIVVNIQGDEPLISPAAIDKLVNALKSDKSVSVATLATVIKGEAELRDQNIVKVVFNQDGQALYFSRHPIPFWLTNGKKNLDISSLQSFYAHIGVYAFRKNFLLKFVSWKPSRLEKLERLEQLRILENGYPIKVVKTNYRSQAVDTPKDIKTVEQILRGKR